MPPAAWRSNPSASDPSEGRRRSLVSSAEVAFPPTARRDLLLAQPSPTSEDLSTELRQAEFLESGFLSAAEDWSFLHATVQRYNFPRPVRLRIATENFVRTNNSRYQRGLGRGRQLRAAVVQSSQMVSTPDLRQAWFKSASRDLTAGPSASEVRERGPNLAGGTALVS